MPLGTVPTVTRTCLNGIHSAVSGCGYYSVGKVVGIWWGNDIHVLKIELLNMPTSFPQGTSAVSCSRPQDFSTRLNNMTHQETNQMYTKIELQVLVELSHKKRILHFHMETEVMWPRDSASFKVIVLGDYSCIVPLPHWCPFTCCLLSATVIWSMMSLASAWGTDISLPGLMHSWRVAVAVTGDNTAYTHKHTLVMHLYVTCGKCTHFLRLEPQQIHAM